MTKPELLAAIYKEIDNLPPIPDNIIKIKELIDDPNSTSHKIAKYVKRDPSLTANLLRIANSAWYAVVSRVDSVDRAITIIGLKQLSNIIMTIGAKTVLNERYGPMEEVWDESYQCAFYSQYLMKMKSKTSDDLESAYTAGLLHNVGKIVLLSLSPELSNRINALSEKKGMEVHVVEKLALGVSTAEIGQKITEEWNFPIHISKTIGNYKTPKLANEEYAPLTYTVYLAHTLGHLTTLTEDFLEKLEPKVLEYFELDDNDKIRKLARSLKQFFIRMGNLP